MNQHEALEPIQNTGDLLVRLRQLRRKANKLNSTLLTDLRSFYDTRLNTFFRLESGAKIVHKPEVSVTTTCSCLMALAVSGQLLEFYRQVESDVNKTLRQILRSEWASAGLPGDNAFTKTLVLRCLAVLADEGVITVEAARNLVHKKRGRGSKGARARRILRDLAAGLPKSLDVETEEKGKEYEHPSTLGYWFTDALKILQSNKSAASWKKVLRWSSREFKRQLALVSADHDTLMDPISMIMAACLYKKSSQEFSPIPEDEILSQNEFNYAVKKLFERQLDSGNWPKYFPLFHYPKAGANHCFSYEMLEAVINEFGQTPIMLQEHTLDGIEKAIGWCENNQLNHLGKHAGWHSGGEVDTLAEGKPETWATAVVHIFLHKLQEVLSFHIQKLVLERYKATAVSSPSATDWNDLISVQVKLQNPEKTKDAKSILTELEKSFKMGPLMTKKRSALIFGPPGTSKTRMIRAFAKKLGWPLVEINPSHFLLRGLELIYLQANEVFENLMDLSDVVIFFDEMDAATLEREKGAGVVEQFLTTFMLPKIAGLYDNGKSIFFMATNHQARLDAAIKRPGRFDFQICIGPASWASNMKKLEKLCDGLVRDDKELGKVRQLLKGWVDNSVRKNLNNFTFGEIRALLEAVRRKYDKDKRTLSESMIEMGPDEFKHLVQLWHDAHINLRKGGEALKRFKDDIKASRRQ